MEERGSAHRVTQRRLAGSPEEIAPDAERDPLHASDAPSVSPAATVPPAPVTPRGPSDVELRKRQRAWREERARFERSKRDPGIPDGTAK